MKSNTPGSQSNPSSILEILIEHENKRGCIVEEYFNKFKDLTARFEELCQDITTKAEQMEVYNNEKHQETNYLASMATQFYEKLQRALVRF